MTKNDLQRAVREAFPEVALISLQPLAGGISASVFQVEIQVGDQTRKLVAKEHGEFDRRRNPAVHQLEFDLLSHARALGIPASKPLILETGGTIPILFIEMVEGETDTEGRISAANPEEFAQVLAQIHAAPLPADMPSQLERVRRRLNNPDPELAAFADTLKARWPGDKKLGLLHGDYWPGNTVWQGDRIAAVIDWEDACVGDPMADVANARAEHFIASGMEAADAFAHHYLQQSPTAEDSLPFWETWAAARLYDSVSHWGLSQEETAAIRAKLLLFGVPR